LSSDYIKSVLFDQFPSFGFGAPFQLPNQRVFPYLPKFILCSHIVIPTSSLLQCSIVDLFHNLPKYAHAVVSFFSDLGLQLL
jgi:hypothetical protein